MNFILKYNIAILCTYFFILLLSSCQEKIGKNEAFYKQNDVDSILYTLKDPLKIEQYVEKYQQENNQYGAAIAYKRLGTVLREKNNFTAAIEAHTAAYNLALQLRDTSEIIFNLNNIGTNYRRLSMYKEATTHHYAALKFCELYSDQESYSARKNKVVSLNGIGNISLRLGDLVTADSVFRIALEGEKSLGSYLGQAINYANLGSIFESRGILDSAWVYYRKSMEMNAKTNSKTGIALCHGYFGDLYEKEGKTALAITEYEKAFQMEDEIDAWHWLNSCVALVRTYIKLGEYGKALSILDKAKIKAEEGKSSDRLATIHYLYYEIYDNTGDKSKALDAYKLSTKYNNSVLNEKNLIQIHNERVKYEHERRQQEIDAINHNFQKEKKIHDYFLLISFILVVLSIVTIASLLYGLQLRKKRQQAMLELDDIRTSFFTNITHEFRTPLTIIIGLAQRLKKMKCQESDEETNLVEIGHTICHQSNNLLLLINQILDLSKVKSTIYQEDFRHGNIVGYIHTIVESTRELTRNKHIELLFSPKQQVIEMDFIPDYITKIISNLISNAIKFTPPNGRIYLTISIVGNNAKICVADNGCGIPHNEVERIFDIFYQGHNGRTEIGTGIGLSLVQQLIHNMQGKITVTSAENEGTVFVITLPLKQSDKIYKPLTEEEEIIPAQEDKLSEKPIEDKEADDNSPVILVVEDNHDILQYIGSVIENAHIYYAQNGKEGLEKAEKIIPDIIITDLMMPEMDGLEMSRNIRNDELLCHIPIIVITAKCTQQDKIKGIQAGVNTYLYKPFNQDELNATIATTLEHRRHMQKNLMRSVCNLPVQENVETDTNNQIFINKVIDIIYSQMQHKEVNISDIASALCISSKQLSRKITAITGESLAKYIQQVRMNRAKQLLDSPKNHTIADVAMRCGFDENSNFTRAFKAIYGVTPSQYRKQPTL